MAVGRGRLAGGWLAGDSDEERGARLDGRAGGSSVGNVCHIAGENCPVAVLGGVGGELTGDGDDGRMTDDGDDEWWMTPRAPAAQRPTE